MVVIDHQRPHMRPYDASEAAAHAPMCPHDSSIAPEVGRWPQHARPGVGFGRASVRVSEDRCGGERRRAQPAIRSWTPRLHASMPLWKWQGAVFRIPACSCERGRFRRGVSSGARSRARWRCHSLRQQTPPSHANNAGAAASAAARGAPMSQTSSAPRSGRPARYGDSGALVEPWVCGSGGCKRGRRKRGRMDEVHAKNTSGSCFPDTLVQHSLFWLLLHLGFSLLGLVGGCGA